MAHQQARVAEHADHQRRTRLFGKLGFLSQAEAPGGPVQLRGDEQIHEDALVVEQLVLSHIGTELNPEKLDLLVKTFARRDAAARRAVSFPPYRRPVPIEQVYVDLLKNPLIVGETRATLLAVLEEATGQAFQGDQWRFVDWATQTEAGRAMQLDLESPPPWELADHRPRSLSATTDDAQESRPEVSRCSGGD